MWLSFPLFHRFTPILNFPLSIGKEYLLLSHLSYMDIGFLQAIQLFRVLSYWSFCKNLIFL